MFTAFSTILAQADQAINIGPGGQFSGLNNITIATIISALIILVLIIAALIFFFMLVWGGIKYITSGGDKDSVGKARSRIINALIGLAVLAIAFALFQVAGQFLGFNVLNFNIPEPDQTP